MVKSIFKQSVAWVTNIVPVIINKIKVSLFWKLLLWFWATVVTIISSLFIIVAIITNPAELMYERQMLFNELDIATHKIVDSKNISFAMVTPVFPENGYFLFDFYGNVIGSSAISKPVSTAYSKSKNSSIPQIFFDSTMVIVGPQHLTINNIPVMLYLTKPIPKILQWRIALLIKNYWYLVIYAIFISLFCCYLLTRYIAKPITNIQKIAVSLAKGKLSARIPKKIVSRKDEIGNLASSFNYMAQELMANIDSKKNLLRYVSHELRSPLTRLRLASAILVKTDDNSEFYDRIELEINRMDYLIKQILDFSRITNGYKVLNKSNIHLNQWIKQLINDCNFEAELANKQISLLTDNHNIMAYIDSDLLASACENIIRNAIRHTPENSNIIVSIISHNVSYIDIIIRDNGSGIPKKVMSSIFTPFASFKEDKTNGFAGFGLGMSIAKEVIEMHNGSLFIENLARGCKITLRFPTVQIE